MWMLLMSLAFADPPRTIEGEPAAALARGMRDMHMKPTKKGNATTYSASDIRCTATHVGVMADQLAWTSCDGFTLDAASELLFEAIEGAGIAPDCAMMKCGVEATAVSCTIDASQPSIKCTLSGTFAN